MKKLRFLVFSLLAVCVFSLPVIAQTMEAYNADNGEESIVIKRMTITITQTASGYEVGGIYSWQANKTGTGTGAHGPKQTCVIHGTYFAANVGFKAWAVCENGDKLTVDGFRVPPNQLQIRVESRDPWSTTATKIPPKMTESEGGYTATWTLLPSGNEFHSKWNNGAEANLKIVRFSSKGVRIERGDTSQSVSKNFSAVYTGTMLGNGVSGKVVFTQNGRTWEGSWIASW